jgi:hypothetical protein
MAFNVLKKPWLHFLVIGAVLYSLQSGLQPQQLAEIALPTEERVAELRGQWLRSTGYPPTQQQVQQLIDREINQEILFQEALRYQWQQTDLVIRQRLIRDVLFVDPDNDGDEQALFEQALDLQLHLNDLVVRRRLIQRMEMMAFAPIRQGPVDEAALLALYENDLGDYVRAPLISFDHIFISRDQNDDPQQTALSMQAKLSGLNELTINTFSDPFMHGFEFTGLSQTQLSRYFGVDFSKQLFGQLSNNDWQQRWLGPLASSYGQHLIWVKQVEPAQQKPFEQVRKQILAQWRREQERLALQGLINQLRSEYGFDAS